MISLSEVLRATVVAADRRALTVPDRDVVGPVLAARLEAAREEGYAAGHRDGRAEGERTARAHLDGLATAVDAALAATRADLASVRATQAAEITTLAGDIARVVLAREPSRTGADALAAVEQALAELDDTDLTVSVAPDDVDMVSRALAGQSGVTVVADARLGVGEARVRGAHAAADLTREAIWSAVDAALATAAESAAETAAETGDDPASELRRRAS